MKQSTLIQSAIESNLKHAPSGCIAIPVCLSSEITSKRWWRPRLTGLLLHQTDLVILSNIANLRCCPTIGHK